MCCGSEGHSANHSATYNAIIRTGPSRDQLVTNIRANDLKTRGIASIEEALANSPEAIVSVRGSDRFVVMELARYHSLREAELEAALAQSRADIREGRFVKESAQAHVARALSLDANQSAPRIDKPGTKPGRPSRAVKPSPAKARKPAAR